MRQIMMSFSFFFRSVLVLFIFVGSLPAQPVAEHISWPEGKQLAISLTFDDGRPSQVDRGMALLERLNARATFYVLPSAVRARLDDWKAAVAQGQEIGNHSLRHPCTGNFSWSREKALETYALDSMRAELQEANRQIEELLGVTPRSFAYPCGQTFVGRGTNTQSYVPLVAELFRSGRGWLDEAPNDPAFCDFAQLMGMEMDGKGFEELLPAIEAAREAGGWLILAGHEMGDSGPQTTSLNTLTALIQYAQDEANGVWLAPVGKIADYLHRLRTP